MRIQISDVGATSSSESMRSSTPPCPGRMVPKSLMPIVRLRSDSMRSPRVEKIATATAKAMKPAMVVCSARGVESIVSTSLNCENATPPRMAQSASPPKKPSHDFLGEMR